MSLSTPFLTSFSPDRNKNMQKKKKKNLNKNNMLKEYKLNLSAFQSRSSHLFSIHLRTQHLKSFLIVKGFLKTFFSTKNILEKLRFWNNNLFNNGFTTTRIVLHVPVSMSLYPNNLTCTVCTRTRVCVPKLPELYFMYPYPCMSTPTTWIVLYVPRIRVCVPQLPELYLMYPYPCLCNPTTWIVLNVPVSVPL